MAEPVTDLITPGHPEASNVAKRLAVGLAKIKTGQQIPVTEQKSMLERLARFMGDDPQARQKLEVETMDQTTKQQVEKALQSIVAETATRRQIGQLENEMDTAKTQQAKDEAWGRYQQVLREALGKVSPDLYQKVYGSPIPAK